MLSPGLLEAACVTERKSHVPAATLLVQKKRETIPSESYLNGGKEKRRLPLRRRFNLNNACNHHRTGD